MCLTYGKTQGQAIDYLEEHGIFLVYVQQNDFTLFNYYFNLYSGLKHLIKAACCKNKVVYFIDGRTIQTWQAGFTKLLQGLSSGRFSSLSMVAISLCAFPAKEQFMNFYIQLDTDYFYQQCYCGFVTDGDNLSFKGRPCLLTDLLSDKIQFLNEKPALLRQGAMEGRWN